MVGVGCSVQAQAKGQTYTLGGKLCSSSPFISSKDALHGDTKSAKGRIPSENSKGLIW